jgi:hypothetical protein
MIEESIRGDVLTSARIKQNDIEKVESARGGVEFRATQNPLDYYLKRKNITVHEFRAGDRLFRDFSVSGQTQSMIADLNPVKGGLKNYTQKQMDARDRWREAMASVDGLVGKLMVLNVCCYGYWLKDINYNPYGPAQAMPRFKEALCCLIKHYKKPID